MPLKAAQVAGRRIYPNQILDEVPADLGLVVVIPCYREETVIPLLESLERNRSSRVAVEVILVILTSDQDSEEVSAENQRIYWEVGLWNDAKFNLPFTLHTLHFQGVPHELMGVDLARKLGMDEGADRLRQARQPNGILTTLDADTSVGPTYIESILTHYESYPDSIGGILPVSFAAPANSSEREVQALQWLSLQTTYYELGALKAGYPLGGFTHSAVFSCRAWAYSEGKGIRLNNGRGVEHLWQYLVQAGPVGKITDTRITVNAKYTPRHEEGMGAQLKMILQKKQTKRKVLAPEIFSILAAVNRFGESLYKLHRMSSYQHAMAELPYEARAFLVHEGVHLHWREAQQGSHWLDWFDRERWKRAMQFWEKEMKYQLPVEEAVAAWLHAQTGWEEESLRPAYLLKRLLEVGWEGVGSHRLKQAS